MICDHYKQILLELAAAGGEPDAELRAHLQTCSACRSAFEDERNLFANIDSCLRSSANTDVPFSFIPTIRAQLWRASPPARGVVRLTDRLLWISALAAAAIILFIVAHLDRQVKSPSTDEHYATKRIEPPIAGPPAGAKPLQDSGPKLASEIAKSSASKPVIMPQKKSLQNESSEPQIIVPPDQETLLACYADQWSRHRHSPTLVTQIDADQTDPPPVQLIQIAALDVKPLADGQKDDQEYGQE